MEKKESWLERNAWFFLLMGFCVSILGMLYISQSLQSQLQECQETCGSEQYAKELEADLLFYHDSNRGLHFLDEDGCEWRIVIEPATAYVDCKQPQPEEKGK